MRQMSESKANANLMAIAWLWNFDEVMFNVVEKSDCAMLVLTKNVVGMYLFTYVIS